MPFTLKKGKSLYHGSFWTCKDEEGAWKSINSSRSDFNVVWFTDKEYIAQKFSIEHDSNQPEKKDVDIILKGKASRDLHLFEMENDCFEYGNECLSYKDMMELKGYSDVRELYQDIPPKFDGVIASGSVGYDLYDDIALFEPLRSIDITHVKQKPSRKNVQKWSKYYEIDKKMESFNKKCKK